VVSRLDNAKGKTMNSVMEEPRTDRKSESVNTVISLKGIVRSFETDRLETRALSGIYLDVQEGDFLSIFGPSGCGKSTLLSIIGLLDNATAGSYCLDGMDVTKLDAKRRSRIRNERIGFVFQNFNLIGEMSVFENVELPLLYRGVPDKERRIRVREVLDLVEMSHRDAHLPSQLSGGQQQRVAVARALVGRPKILLADEPTGNLDSHNGDAVMKLMCSLHQSGATICMVTHNEEYNALASRVIHLMDGRVVSESRLNGEN
jgi:putative ABC transport system ATP-binding protein